MLPTLRLLTQRRPDTGAGGVNDVDNPLPDSTITEWNDITQEDADNGRHATPTNALVHLCKESALWSSLCVQHHTPWLLSIA